ncbi:hypothetical protein UlMin_016930 [Ulmus minor]
MACKRHLLSPPLLFTTFFLLAIFPYILIVNAIVPSTRTFTYKNKGEFGEYLAEYNSIMRWVLEANRNKPVRENATLSFNSNGNLVLVDANGTIAWQTGKANKGFVGLNLLPNGNLVLYDAKNNFIWQSFDHPTDTLLVGQAPSLNGPNVLLGRKTNVDRSKELYGFFLVENLFSLCLTSKHSDQGVLPYYNYELSQSNQTLVNLTFYSQPETEKACAFELGLRYYYHINDLDTISLKMIFSRPKYNSTYSMLRLESDGNLRVYTYYEHVDWDAWEVSFKLFDVEYGNSKSACKLPKKCGEFGICENDQWVACPSPMGLKGWAKNCTPPALPQCDGGPNMDYFKVAGVTHFLNWTKKGDGPMKLGECRGRCDKSCDFLGFFYDEKTSMCLLTPVIGTLSKVSSIVGYIKMPKKVSH